MQLPNTIIYNLLIIALTCVLVSTLRNIALKIQLVDAPGGRKQHQGDIPLVGGIAMFCGFFIALSFLPISLTHYYPLLASTALLVLVGAIDDFRELSARFRLVAQFIAMLIIILLGHITLNQLGNLLAFGTLYLGYFAIPFTLFATLSLINAVNMMDGIDGLAGSLTVVSLLFMVIVSLQAQRHEDVQVLLTAISVLIAFLCFNFPWPWRAHASVFMGDAGSLFLGGLVAWFSISLSQGSEAAVHPVIMLWFLAVPLFDLATVFTIRLRQKRSPFDPGREHMHHHLLDQGFSARRTLLLMCLAAIIMGSIGLLGHYLKIADSIMLLLFIAIYIYYLHTILQQRAKTAIPVVG